MAMRRLGLTTSVMLGAALLAACGPGSNGPGPAAATVRPRPTMMASCPRAAPRPDLAPSTGSPVADAPAGDIAFDPAIQQFVLVPALPMQVDEALDDGTYLFDGGHWRRYTATPRPHRLPLYSSVGSAMVWDACDGTLIFVDRDMRGSSSRLTTWTFDGVQWTEQTGASLTGGEGGSVGLAYDDATGQTLLVASDPSKSPPDAPLIARSWVWQGGAWRAPAGTAGAPKGAGHLAYDPTSGTLAWLNPTQTWSWDGTQWSPASQASAAPQDLQSVAPDLQRSELIGVGVNGSVTYIWDGKTWQTVKAAPGAMNMQAAALLWDPRVPAAIGYVFDYDVNRMTFVPWRGDHWGWGICNGTQCTVTDPAPTP